MKLYKGPRFPIVAFWAFNVVFVVFWSFFQSTFPPLNSRVKMARAEKKKTNPQSNPETIERNRLKKLAISNNVLSNDGPAKVSSSLSASTSSSVPALAPSKIVTKHHGRDILKKSQRKNKFLLSFPGLLAPVSGGKIGELKDLGTKNPILYLEFPQGKMKLFGTIVFPKNRYLTMQFSRGGKNVMCEDNFDTMIVFSEAWWIGNKDENPEEVRLEFPKEMNMVQHTDYDFKGGAGAACERKQTFMQARIEHVDQVISKRELHDDLSDTSNDLEDLTMLTPSRHSARTAGKSYKFAEASSGDDSVEEITGTSEEKEKLVDLEYSEKKLNSGKTSESDLAAHNMENEDSVAHTSMSQIQQSATSITKSKNTSHINKSSLVQATISNMFKKIDEQVLSKKQNSSSKVSGSSLPQSDSNRKSYPVEEVQGPSKKKKVSKEKKTGTKSTARKKKVEDEDDIEEFSSTSKDTFGSDEDWNA